MATINSLYQHFLQHPIVCTDTRSITDGCLFFALKGDKFDANTFAAQAISQGAAYAIIDDENYQTDDRCILVPNVLTALQDLAKHHRNQLTIPVIGLTGSNGKTTTKELIRAVLAQKYTTFATKGNLNNHIGVPLSILSLTPQTEIAVIEMGANHQKEIEFLCDIAQPTHGLITNIGMAHLDGFGGFEGVKKGKAELFAYLKNHEGIAFINRNNPYLLEMSGKAMLNKVIYYGTEANNAISGKLIKSDPFIELSWTSKSESFQTEIHLTGAYNFENILAAICIAQFFEVSPDQINAGLSGYQPNNNRSQITKTATNTVICDFYNANPSSMAAALKNIELLSSDNKAVIIGDMFELGQESPEQHKIIIEQAEKLKTNTLIFIGHHFYDAKQSHKGHFFETPDEAATFLKEHPINNNLILLKGSRGMALEQLLPLL
ncbi:MAG: UDP-N-acetylmuramoyl-tripeptide--D-alanyl-D-alanine ligase [Candidatus Pedobacter colombiensis]|uniref:UDP-N-acetylmuramoyl-tripeptide--D-alanyl-D-alanine ligase n=1 Tax=Candidatus Pedobacter colombiensis TaxID=3121371 RepID=A0AAJ5WAT7_9SPHI|nr:UDP-N-acetylmuramoyl-tripeptide--D-alanyl-D-alanine ligase [Pedobacter sp.]WEK19392.1 MAG: UDP-N-acetylmuramoyl-tripeptide--D-alanyl-D-alanine ligase [Pedobacter sp.]